LLAVLSLLPAFDASAQEHSRIKRKPPSAIQAERIALDMAMNNSPLQKAVIWFGHRLTAARKSIRQCRNGGLQILAARLHHPRRDRIGKVRRFANAGSRYWRSGYLLLPRRPEFD